MDKMIIYRDPDYQMDYPVADKVTGPPKATFLYEKFLAEFTKLRYGLCTIRVVTDENNPKADCKELKELLKKTFDDESLESVFSYDHISIGEHYLGRWYNPTPPSPTLRRVKVTELNGSMVKIKCIDVDNGLHVSCYWQDLFILSGEALQFPGQNFEVLLKGTDFFYGTTFLRRIMDKPPQLYIVKTINTDKEIHVVDFFNNPFHRLDKSITSQVYDKIPTIFEHKYSSVGEIKPVFVTDWGSDGTVAYQYQKSVKPAISNYLEKFDATSAPEAKVKDINDAKLSTVYLYRLKEWYHRVRAVELRNETVLIEFVDFGDQDYISANELIEAGKINTLLEIIPQQHIRAKLSGIVYIEKPDFIGEVVNDKTIYVKMDSLPGEIHGLASVSLYFSEDSKKCINSMLLDKGYALAKKP